MDNFICHFVFVVSFIFEKECSNTICCFAIFGNELRSLKPSAIAFSTFDDAGKAKNMHKDCLFWSSWHLIKWKIIAMWFLFFSFVIWVIHRIIYQQGLISHSLKGSSVFLVLSFLFAVVRYPQTLFSQRI